MGRVGLISHPSYLEHEMGAGHPECPERLRAILAQIQSTGTWKDLVQLEPSPATSDWIETAPTYAILTELYFCIISSYLYL